MYYEERVIDGILCHRGTPDGGWTPFTREELTQMIGEAKELLAFFRRYLRRIADNELSCDS